MVFCMRMTTPSYTALSVGAVGWSMNSDANKKWETHRGFPRSYYDGGPPRGELYLQPQIS